MPSAEPAESILDVQRRAHAGELRHVPVDQLGRSPFQPRVSVKRDDAFDSLVKSVAKVGVVQPVIVRELVDGIFELIAGERRLEAAKACGLATIPARVLTITKDVTAQAIALAENCARADLSTWEQAQTLGALKSLCASEKLDTNVRSLARMVGISKSLAADLIMVAERLDARVRAAVEQSGAPLACISHHG
jgi:ParB family chromosome partitioning protein